MIYEFSNEVGFKVYELKYDKYKVLFDERTVTNRTCEMTGKREDL